MSYRRYKARKHLLNLLIILKFFNKIKNIFNSNLKKKDYLNEDPT